MINMLALTKSQTKIILILSMIFLFFVSCHRVSERKSNLIRIIDYLTDKDIVESPLRHLADNFDHVEDNLSGKWIFLLPGSYLLSCLEFLSEMLNSSVLESPHCFDIETNITILVLHQRITTSLGWLRFHRMKVKK